MPIDIAQWTKADADKFYSVKEDIKKLGELDPFARISMVAVDAGINIREVMARGTLSREESKRLQEAWKRSPFHLSEDFLTALFEAAY